MSRWISSRPTGSNESTASWWRWRASVSHNLRKCAASGAVRRGRKEAGLTSCQAFADGMVVQLEKSGFEPDALLRSGPSLPRDASWVAEPLGFNEVLPPDSGTRDRATKLCADFKRPSVPHYRLA